MPRSAPTSAIVPLSVATLGMASFSIMDVIMKGLSISVGAYNAMLWRMLAGAVVGGALFVFKGERWPPHSTFKLHLLRGSITAVSAFSFFWGLVRVPLAEAVALSFIAPLITLYLAAALLGERIGRTAIAATLVGFAGVLVILSARISGDYPAEVLEGIAAILFSAVLYAYNLILQRKQAQLASPVEIAFFQNLTAGGALLILAPWLGAIPDARHVPAIAGATVTATIASLLLSWSYARAEAQVLIPVEYTAFIWAAIFGWYVYGEPLTAATLVGTGLIVAGCVITARQKSQARPEHVEVTAL